MTLQPAPRFGPDTPTPGRVVEVVPGVFWLRFPLPFALDHVNLWALEDGRGWTVVDTGVGDRASQRLWRELLAGPLAGRPVTRLIVTHYHPDHVGLAGWLVAATGCAFRMPETEWLTARLLASDTSDAALDTALDFYRAAGLETRWLDALTHDGHAYSRRVTPPPLTFDPLRAGETLRIGEREFEVWFGEGHAPQQACLWCAADRLLIAADQILPRISPNIPVWPQTPDADPLGRYVASLERFRTLPPDTRALPAHDWPFADLHGRIDSLIAHHDERLAATLDAARGGATAQAVLTLLFPRLGDVHQLRFALGETLAHLNRLRVLGAVERTRERGVWRYVPTR